MPHTRSLRQIRRWSSASANNFDAPLCLMHEQAVTPIHYFLKAFNKRSSERFDMSPCINQRGFTLIELLVTLSIALILMTVAVPGFQSFLLQSRLTGHTNDLVLGLAFAKSEAVKRGRNVSVCASSNSSTCTGGWDDGWIVRSNDGQVLQVHTGFSGTICADANTIDFRNTGFPTAGIVFDLYDSRGAGSGRKITVSAQGRAATTTGASACS